MASNINPNNIDNTYPIAGQDNDSQGFRDNFTNIKTNFQYANTEIGELQNNALLTSPLTGGATLNTQNDMKGSPIKSALMQDMREVVAAETSAGTDLDVSEASYHPINAFGDMTINFVGWPAAGNISKIRVEFRVTVDPGLAPIITNDISFPVTTIGMKALYGNPVANTISVPNGIYVYECWSTNNGDQLFITALIEEPATP